MSDIDVVSEEAPRRARPQKYTPRRQMIAQIREEIRERVLSGTWRPGMLIPSRRTIADEFDVNRMTVQRALSSLLEDNILVSDGRGTFVAEGARGGNSSSAIDSPNPVTESYAPSFMRNTIVFVSIVPPGNYSYRHATGWMHVLDTGVSTAVRQAGFHLMTLSPRQIETEEWAHIIQSRPLAVVVGSCEPENPLVAQLKACENARIPVVLFGDVPAGLRCDMVASDHRAGAYQLTNWLLAGGRRRVLTLLPHSDFASWPCERRRGYEEALRDANVGPPRVLEVTAFGPHSPWGDDCFEDTTRLLAGYIAPYLLDDQPIDAIMAASDGSVPAIACACRLLRRVPNKDVVIVGYDNYWSESETAAHDATTPLATVDKRNFLIGEELVRLAIARSRGDVGDEPVRRLIEPELVVVR